MVLTYLNYLAMIVGYITISIIILFILLFTGLFLREKYMDWKWKKDQEKKQKEHEEKQSNASGSRMQVAGSQTTQSRLQSTEQQKEIPKEATPEGSVLHD